MAHGESAFGRTVTGLTYSLGDLWLVVVGALAIASAIEVVLPPSSPVRTLLVLPFLFFLPGYAVIAALFPGRPTRGWHEGGIDWVERTALAFGTSLAVLPIVVLGISLGGLALTPSNIVLPLTVVILLGAIVGAIRRIAIPRTQRLRAPAVLQSATDRSVFSGSRSTWVINGLLVASILFVGAAAGYAVAGPAAPNSFSQFYLLHENPDGEFVAGGYPDQVTAGESIPLVVGIENREHTAERYTVVVQLQQVRDGEVTVREEVRRFQIDVESDETIEREHQITPEITGEDLRVTYLLYKDTPPESPTSENAYRRVFFWVNVEAAD